MRWAWLILGYMLLVTAEMASCVVGWKANDLIYLDKVTHLINMDHARVNQTDPEGWTPLHYAAYSGDCEAAEAFLGAGADINAYDLEGQTPLNAALAMKNQTMISWLRAHGAKAASPAPYALLFAGTTLVPLKHAASVLGLTLTYDPQRGQIVLRGDGVHLILIPYETQAVLAGRTITLPKPMIIYQQSAYVPLRTLALATHTRITWDQQENTVTTISPIGDSNRWRIKLFLMSVRADFSQGGKLDTVFATCYNPSAPSSWLVEQQPRLAWGVRERHEYWRQNLATDSPTPEYITRMEAYDLTGDGHPELLIESYYNNIGHEYALRAYQWCGVRPVDIFPQHKLTWNERGLLQILSHKRCKAAPLVIITPMLDNGRWGVSRYIAEEYLLKNGMYCRHTQKMTKRTYHLVDDAFGELGIQITARRSDKIFRAQ